MWGTLGAPAKPDYVPSITLRGPPLRQNLEFPHRLPFSSSFLAKFPAFIRFAVERLCHCGRTAHLAEKKNVDVKISTVVGDAQPIPEPDFPRRLGRLPIRKYPAQFTGLFRQWPRLEESRSPKPDIHPYAGH